MRKRFQFVVSAALCLWIIVFGLVYFAAEKTLQIASAESLSADTMRNEILESYGDIQTWINDTLTPNAGVSSEWYVLTLCQYGDTNSYDYAAYQTALLSYLYSQTISSATSRQKYALVLIALGSSDSYIQMVLDDSIGQQGVMSWIYGLHLLNNSYASNAGYSIDSVTNMLLSLQLSDGGWAITGTTSDVDITAMALQALSPQYNTNSSVTTAIDAALLLLSERQLSDGDFSSYGTDNAESTAQVLTALSALGIDAMTDSRFCKEGNIFDGLLKYRVGYGTYAHTANGSTDATATVQIFYALVAYWRMQNGWGSFYILDNRNPDALIEDVTAETTLPAITTETNSNNTQKQNNTDSLSDADADDSSKSNNGTKTKSTTTVSKKSNSTTSTEIRETTASEKTTVRSSENTYTSEASTKTTQYHKTAAQINTTGTTTSTEQAALSVSENTNHTEQSGLTIRLIGSAILLLLAGSICIWLIRTRHRHVLNFCLVGVGTIVLLLLVWLVRFQSTEEYYNDTNNTGSTDSSETDGTVTLTISCQTVGAVNDIIPENGYILEETVFPFTEGDTVYDILLIAAKENEILIDNTGSKGQAYIAGIQSLYEFDYGDLSGWLYYVNGETPSVNCEAYILNDGDDIVWQYTCDMGKNLE